MLVHWIWLTAREGLGDRSRRILMEYFSDAEDIYFAQEDAFSSIEGLSEEACASLRDKDLARAEAVLRDCTRQGIHVLTWRDAAYPARLRNITDPPLVLYYKGMLPDFDGLPLIAVVGTRTASAYGLSTAKRMGSQIASCGGIVVSGMAIGIDSMAMQGALTAGGPVIGVLGCGVDVVYPARNKALYADVERNGCLLSEFPPGTPPISWNFPRRNRIISGLSCGVLVVEAPRKSGALITARQAADQGRDVFVVPGNIDVDSCEGSNALLRDGAIAVSSGWDVVGEYEALFPGKIRNSRLVSVQTVSQQELEQVCQEVLLPEKKPKEKRRKPSSGKKEIDNRPASAYSDAEEIPLTEEQARIVSVLGTEEMLVDELMARLDLPAGQVLATLTLLEIKGVIKRLPGRRVAMKK